MRHFLPCAVVRLARRVIAAPAEDQMSRGGKKLTKTEKRARRLHKDAQALDALVKDTAAVFRSSSETVEDCATECDRRRDDLEADLKYRRLASHIWRWRPG